MSAQLSPDGLYYWDGTQWQSTLSHDRRTRWNGSDWVPVQGNQTWSSATSSQAGKKPTSWTRPLQYAVAGWYALSAIYALSLPFWMSGTMTQAIDQSIQRQQALHPTASPLPTGFAGTMGSVMSGVLWVAAIFGVVICLVLIIGALQRWIWVFYVVLVLTGLGAISAPVNLINAVSGSSVAAASGFSMPAQIFWLGALFSVPNIALFVWMVIALARRGPWAMTRIQVT